MRPYVLIIAPILCAALSANARTPAVAQTTAGPRTIPMQPVVVPIARVALAPASLAGLPRRQITVTEDGKTTTYAGVDLGAVLAKNGAPYGAELHGNALADYAIAIGADGYRAVYALPELDSSFGDEAVLLADTRDGASLGTDVGPLRIVVPDEKKHARWVRGVVEIDVLAAPYLPALPHASS